MKDALSFCIRFCDLGKSTGIGFAYQETERTPVKLSFKSFSAARGFCFNELPAICAGKMMPARSISLLEDG